MAAKKKSSKSYFDKTFSSTDMSIFKQAESAAGRIGGILKNAKEDVKYEKKALKSAIKNGEADIAQAEKNLAARQKEAPALRKKFTETKKRYAGYKFDLSKHWIDEWAVPKSLKPAYEKAVKKYNEEQKARTNGTGTSSAETLDAN